MDALKTGSKAIINGYEFLITGPDQLGYLANGIGAGSPYNNSVCLLYKQDKKVFTNTWGIAPILI